MKIRVAMFSMVITVYVFLLGSAGTLMTACGQSQTHASPIERDEKSESCPIATCNSERPFCDPNGEPKLFDVELIDSANVSTDQLVYWRDAYGSVHVDGYVTVGPRTDGSPLTLFVLPTGYRPETEARFSLAASSDVSEYEFRTQFATIDESGEFTLVFRADANTELTVYVNGVSFYSGSESE